MKKQLRDYKGKDYAIFCRNQEEWEKIGKLVNYPIKEKYKPGEWDTIGLNYQGWLHLASYRSSGTTILEAKDFLEDDIPQYVECIGKDSGIEVGKIYKVVKIDDWCGKKNDVYYLENSAAPYYIKNFKPSTEAKYLAQFQPKEESLVGRYIKYIKPDSGNVKNGDLYLINDNFNCTNLRTNTPACNWDKSQIGNYWELMPKDFKIPSDIQQNSFKVGQYVVWKNNDKNIAYKLDEITQNGFSVISEGESYQYFTPLNQLCRLAKLEEIPVDKLSKEEILEIAKQYFPKGVEYQTIQTDGIYGRNNILSEDPIIYQDSSGCWIIANTNIYNPKFKKWAKIISTPESNEIVHHEYNNTAYYETKLPIQGTVYQSKEEIVIKKAVKKKESIVVSVKTNNFMPLKLTSIVKPTKKVKQVIIKEFQLTF